jgi:hypothetical protein
MKGFADLGDLPEDDRIKIIATAAAAGAICLVLVEDDPKADRYIEKLKQYPIRIVSRIKGTLAGGVETVVVIKVGPKES